ncbi:helicase associated domain-containing protein [Mycobacterium sp.]|uniref:helicase associated domain-containing protein n=1 Tax=Mycobacterium sp. TaxID=1785 RepID=UPI003F955362
MHPSYTTPDGDRLGAWVVDQRNRFARGMLDPDRSARLEELPGWTWGPRRRAVPCENHDTGSHMNSHPIAVARQASQRVDRHQRLHAELLLAIVCPLPTNLR